MNKKSNASDSIQLFHPFAGSDFLPSKKVLPLKYNILNMRVSQHGIGTGNWTNSLISGLRQLRIPNLESIIGTVDAPTRPKFLTKPKRQASNNDTEYDPLVSDRCIRAIEVIKSCDPNHCAAITVNTSYALDPEAALEALLHDSIQLDNFTRRRFDKPAFIFIPEVEIKKVKDVDPSRYADSRWKHELDPEQLIYLIHFHGGIYVSGHSPSDIESAFRLTPSGRRSKLYCGTNQVRATHFHQESEVSKTQGLAGFINYAYKCFYRPTNKIKMLDGAASWLWLTDQIVSDPRLIRIGGIRKIDSQQSISTGDQPSLETNVDSSVNLDDQSIGYTSNSNQPSTHQLHKKWFVTNDSSYAYYLNCLSLTIWNEIKNAVIKKIGRVTRFRSFLDPKFRKIVAWIRGP